MVHRPFRRGTRGAYRAGSGKTRARRVDKVVTGFARETLKAREACRIAHHAQFAFVGRTPPQSARVLSILLLIIDSLIFCNLANKLRYGTDFAQKTIAMFGSDVSSQRNTCSEAFILIIYNYPFNHVMPYLDFFARLRVPSVLSDPLCQTTICIDFSLDCSRLLHMYGLSWLRKGVPDENPKKRLTRF